jgi:hypothetical protein
MIDKLRANRLRPTRLPRSALRVGRSSFMRNQGCRPGGGRGHHSSD